jgi:hypothetical protein
MRRARIAFWAQTGGLFAAGAITGHPVPYILASGSALFSKATGYFSGRKFHADLLSSMKSNGVIQPEFENLYPRRWLENAEIAKTHPICYVAQNGDLVLRKPTRMEYYRYLYQQKLPGRAGLQPWRWRVYLQPPEAPEKINKTSIAAASPPMVNLRVRVRCFIPTLLFFLSLFPLPGLSNSLLLTAQLVQLFSCL